MNIFSPSICFCTILLALAAACCCCLCISTGFMSTEESFLTAWLMILIVDDWDEFSNDWIVVVDWSDWTGIDGSALKYNKQKTERNKRNYRTDNWRSSTIRKDELQKFRYLSEFGDWFGVFSVSVFSDFSFCCFGWTDCWTVALSLLKNAFIFKWHYELLYWITGSA